MLRVAPGVYEGDGSEEPFRPLVAAALAEICPVARVVDGGDVCLDVADRDGVCEHLVGSALVATLVDARSEFTVRLPEGGSSKSSYRHEDRSVFWWPGKCGRDMCDCQGQSEEKNPPTPILAHELVHAWDHIRQGEDYDGEGAEEETLAVCVENHVRRELGLPVRCGHEDASPPCVDCGDGWVSWAMGPLLTKAKLLEVRGRCSRPPLVGWVRLLTHLSRRLGWAVRPPVPPVRPSPGPTDDLFAETGFRRAPFEGEEAASTRLLGILGRLREKRSLPLIEDTFQRVDTALILEITWFHSDYGVLLFVADPEPRLLTNFGLRGAGPVRTLGDPGELRERTFLPASTRTVLADWDQLFATLEALNPAGLGKPASPVNDGWAQFLRVKRGGQESQSIHAIGWNLGFPSPKGGGRTGGDRWTALAAVMEFGARLLQVEGGTSRPLRPR